MEEKAETAFERFQMSDCADKDSKDIKNVIQSYKNISKELKKTHV